MIDFPSETELALRLVAAAVLGAIIGLEREVYDHPAGLRTHLGVALGSALFAMVSAYGFEIFGQAPRDDTSFQVDVTRVASNIVTGVGFLGGGAILKHGVSVKGLTTAASLWVTAAIGLAVGLGTYVLAGVATAAMLASLLGLRKPVRFIERRWSRQEQVLVIRLNDSTSLGEVMEAVRGLPGRQVQSIEVSRLAGGVMLQVDLRGAPGEHLDAAVKMLSQRRDVSFVQAY